MNFKNRKKKKETLIRLRLNKVGFYFISIDILLV